MAEEKGQNSTTFRTIAELVVRVLWEIAKMTKNPVDDLIVGILAGIFGIKLNGK